MTRGAGAVGWIAVGAAGAVGLAAIASIGVFLLAGAGLLAGTLLATRAGGEWWALLGVAAAFVALGVLALPWRSCPSVTPTVSDPPGPGETSSYSCGGIHPAIWFALALGAVVGAIAGARRSTVGRPHRGRRPD